MDFNDIQKPADNLQELLDTLKNTNKKGDELDLIAILMLKSGLLSEKDKTAIALAQKVNQIVKSLGNLMITYTSPNSNSSYEDVKLVYEYFTLMQAGLKQFIDTLKKPENLNEKEN